MTDPKTPTDPSERLARRAQALRANLSRRKQAARRGQALPSDSNGDHHDQHGPAFSPAGAADEEPDNET